MKKALVLLGISAALLASAAVIEPVTLTRDVKAGDSIKSKLTVELDFGGQMVTYSADTTQKVKEVKEGEMVFEETTANSTISIDGQSQPASDDSTATMTYDKAGRIKSMKSDMMDDNAYRFASLIIFMWPDKPVDVGATWDATVEANNDHKTPKTTFKYTLEAFEDVKGKKTAKVKFAITEQEGDTPAKSAGTMWVDIKTGFNLKAEGTMENAPAAGMVINAKFKVEAV